MTIARTSSKLGVIRIEILVKSLYEIIPNHLMKAVFVRLEEFCSRNMGLEIFRASFVCSARVSE